ncbi:MAG: response regulator [Candidatus Zixiibacteriota bacterium]|nr:MAG: response regulator [candidate division Zixibacteria bacterium]
MEGKKILIVDDEPDVVAYLTAFLTDNGFAVRTARDGRDGMEQVRAERPDLITLDINMPEESGVRMYRHLQEDPELKGIPVFIVTGISGSFKGFIETRRQVSPPAGYFEKPIDRQQLLDKAREVLSH